VLNEILNEIDPIAEDGGIMLKLLIKEDFKFEGANRSLLFSMFYNVVNNAVKNTPSGGEITISGYYMSSNFDVTISDTGKGMTDVQINSLFSRFKTQLDINSNNTGIGLAISKSIADFHGIEIKVSSEIQKGSIFTFVFPEIS
jgi:signal transduction histidine kinase